MDNLQEKKLSESDIDLITSLMNEPKNIENILKTMKAKVHFKQMPDSKAEAIVDIEENLSGIIRKTCGYFIKRNSENGVLFLSPPTVGRTRIQAIRFLDLSVWQKFSQEILEKYKECCDTGQDVFDFNNEC